MRLGSAHGKGYLLLQTLRARLIVICVGITLASLLLLSAATFLTVRKDTLAAVDTRIDQLTQIYASQVSDWVKDKQRITSSMQVAITQADPLPLVQATKDAGGFDDAFMVYADDRTAFLHPLPEDFVGTKRPWYQQAMQAGGPALTPVYTDSATGALTISFIEPAGPSGQRLGAFGTDMRIASIAKMVADIRPLAHSFAFLVNTEGLLIAHPKAELALKPVSSIAAALDSAQLQTLAQTHGSASMDIDGVTHLVYARQVDGTPWTLAIAIDRGEALQPVRSLLQVTAGITVLCALLATALLLLALAQQLRRIDGVRSALQDIASGDGDLTRRLSVQGNDELTHISAAFNQFADKIATVLRQIRSASESVHVATQEIATGNQDLSSRTEQQASSLEETAAAMEELTSTVQQNAESARHASELAHNASQVATQGGNVVEQVVQTMGAIQASSQRVGDIISVIDGIAFQTNILALNAAVEAARAGEQGRGFAVVATEVRNLAQRSAQAAKEIKDLIDGSTQQVQSGSQLVQQAGTTMQEVVTRVRQVTDIVAEISAASKEQSVGIAEVGNAVTLMDQATQQNAALVEEATAAAQSLAQQAEQLAQAVAVFRLDAEGAQRALGHG